MNYLSLLIYPRELTFSSPNNIELPFTYQNLAPLENLIKLDVIFSF
jgi:hypothetical protein